MTRIRPIILYTSIIISLLLMPHWVKWQDAPAPFTPTYVLGFVVTTTMLLTVALWGLLGFVGFRQLLANKWRIIWLIALLLLAGWMTISQTWAYGQDTYPGMAQNAALQFWIVALFAIAVASSAPPPRLIIGVLMILLVGHGVVAWLQAGTQASVGLQALGEFNLGPDNRGISVVMAGDTRWMRPYGFLPHPNVLGGVFAITVLAAAGWIFAPFNPSRLGHFRIEKHWLGYASFWFGVWVLLLTFSRGAWLGTGIGILFALPFVLRLRHFWRKLIPLALGTLVVGGLFIASYHPLLLARSGVGEQSIELRSVADRIVYTRIAAQAISERPLQGYGAGNYAWYAANYLYYNTNYDLRGDNVHNIYLGIWSELGLVGFALFWVMMASGMLAALRNATIERVALLAGVAALLIVGLFDHYMWTMIHMQGLWFLLLAVAMGAEQSPPPKLL